jgi:hypothetical protein
MNSKSEFIRENFLSEFPSSQKFTFFTDLIISFAMSAWTSLLWLWESQPLLEVPLPDAIPVLVEVDSPSGKES